MKSVYRATTAAICAFLAGCAVAQGVSTNGTMLADDLTSRSRVVVDAFENSSNRVHELIQEVSPRADLSTNNHELVETITEVTQYTNLATKSDATLHEQEFSDWKIYRNGSNVTEMVNQPYWYELLWVCGGSMIEGDISPDADVSGSFDSEELIWHANGREVTYIATRTCPRGYILGSQSNKVLAAESDITNTVTKSYIESLGIESGISAETATNIANSATNFLTRAEAEAGFTEWVCVPAMVQGQYAISIERSTGESGWRPRYADGEGTGDQKGDGYSTSLSWAADEWMGAVPLTAARTRLPTMADIPTNNLQLINGAGYVTSTITNGLAALSDIPTNTSQLVNDSGFISMVTNIFFLNQYGDFEFDATFKIDSTTDWLSIDYPGYSTFWYPNSNQVEQAISDSITSADTSYRRFVSLTNVNQSVQYVETDDTVTDIAIVAPATGETKDWIVYIYAATNSTLTLPSGITWWTADAANTNAIEAAKPTAFYFSQIHTNIFYLGRQELTTIGGAQ